MGGVWFFWFLGIGMGEAFFICISFFCCYYCSSVGYFFEFEFELNKRLMRLASIEEGVKINVLKVEELR